MKTFADICRFIIISFEAVIFVVSILLYQYEPKWILILGEMLNQNSELLTVLYLSPLAAITWAYSESKSILYPEDNNKVLLQWKDYSMLRNRVIYTLLSILLCVVIGVVILIVKSVLSPLLLGVITFGLFGVLISLLVSLGLASLTIKQVLQKNLD